MIFDREWSCFGWFWWISYGSVRILSLLLMILCDSASLSFIIGLTGISLCWFADGDCCNVYLSLLLVWIFFVNWWIEDRLLAYLWAILTYLWAILTYLCVKLASLLDKLGILIYGTSAYIFWTLDWLDADRFFEDSLYLLSDNISYFSLSVW